MITENMNDEALWGLTPSPCALTASEGWLCYVFSGAPGDSPPRAELAATKTDADAPLIVDAPKRT